MTAQTAKDVDEAFWDLVLSDPDLLDTAFRALTEPDDEPPGPGDGPPADEPGQEDHRAVRGPAAPDAKTSPAPADRPARNASGRVRSPPGGTPRRPAGEVNPGAHPG